MTACHKEIDCDILSQSARRIQGRTKMFSVSQGG
jgi:hypothetical protein